jgi:hypothetical protein
MLSTIRSKVKFAGLVMVILCALGSGSGLLIAASLSGSMGDSARIAEVMRNHMQADMMHDALRADVLAAMLAAQQGQGDAMAGIKADLEEHSSSFREAIDENHKKATNAATIEALNAADEPLQQYIASARQIVNLAATDPAAAQAALPAFKGRFTDLEGRMEAISQQIGSTLKTTTARADFLAMGGIVVMALAILLSVGLSLLLIRQSMRTVVAPIGVLNDEMAALAQGRTGPEERFQRGRSRDWKTPSARSPASPLRSVLAPRRSPRPPTTCRAAPSSRPPAWKRPPPPWTRSPPPCARPPTAPPAPPPRWPRPAPTPNARAKWSAKPSPPWAPSRTPRARSPRSSA